MDKRKVKYMVIPGYVKSPNDGDWHRVSAGDIMRLFGVKYDECFVAYNNKSLLGHNEEWLKSLVVLEPNSKGAYDLQKGKV